MRVAIVGSRDYPDITEVERFVDRLAIDAIVVSGGAYGVDKTAERAAKSRGMKCEIYLADWDEHGKSAGMIRNCEIVKNAEYVIAFRDGKSKGTANTIERALKAKHIKRVTVYKSDGTS